MAIRSQPTATDLVTTGDTTPKYMVGGLYVDQRDDIAYRYVFNDEGSAALDAALICCWSGTGGKSSGKVKKAAATVRGPAGQPTAAIAAQTYGFIQVRGITTTITTS